MTVQVLNGVRNNYGSQTTQDKFPGMVKRDGMVKEMVIDFNYDDLPTYSADGAVVQSIPGDSFIVSARLHVKTAAAGSSGVYHFGLYEADSTVIDIDGLDASVAQATLAEDAWIDCDGALVGATIGAEAGQFVVTLASGTNTGGSYRMIIEYIQPLS